MILRGPIGAAVVLALHACGGEECDLDRQTRDLVGFGLTDCGIAQGPSEASAESCALDAYNGGQLFRVTRERPGGLESLVSAQGGQYYLLRSEGSGGPIEQASCRGARVVDDGDASRVECDRPGDFATVCE